MSGKGPEEVAVVPSKVSIERLGDSEVAFLQGRHIGSITWPANGLDLHPIGKFMVEIERKKNDPYQGSILQNSARFNFFRYVFTKPQCLAVKGNGFVSIPNL